MSKDKDVVTFKFVGTWDVIRHVQNIIILITRYAATNRLSYLIMAKGYIEQLINLRRENDSK